MTATSYSQQKVKWSAVILVIVCPLISHIFSLKMFNFKVICLLFQTIFTVPVIVCNWITKSLIQKKIWTVVRWSSKLLFDPVWLVPLITHMMFGNLKDNFSFKESQILSFKSKVKQRFLWDHTVNYMFHLGQYMSSVETWPSAWQISQRFFQDRGGKILKEMKTIINQVTLRAAATLGILAVRGGKILCCSLYNYVFSQVNTTIWWQTDFFHIKKWSFELTNFTCVIHGTSQTGSKSFPIDCRLYFFVLRSHGVHWKVRDLGALLPNKLTSEN